MAIPNEPITRQEQYLAAMAGQSGTLPDAPITRKEMYLAKAAGQDVNTPEPITREEMYLDVIAESGGSGGGGGGAAGAAFTDIGIKTIGLDINGQTLNAAQTVLDLGNVNVNGFKANKLTSTESNASFEIKCGNLAFADGGALGDHNGSSKLRTIIFSCANNPNATKNEFTRSTKLSRILGKPLLVTNFLSGNYRVFNGSNLTEFYLVPNAVLYGGSGIYTGVLIDASLVSVANALKAVSGQTLTISNAATKAKCGTITGTVSTVGEGDDAYDFFTQDQENGDTTLTEFITNTKGWTLA